MVLHNASKRLAEKKTRVRLSSNQMLLKPLTRPHTFSPRFASVAYIGFEFWLVYWIVYTPCDWLIKSVLYFTLVLVLRHSIENCTALILTQLCFFQPLYDQLVQDNKVPNVFTLGLCNGMVSERNEFLFKLFFDNFEYCSFLIRQI